MVKSASTRSKTLADAEDEAKEGAVEAINAVYFHDDKSLASSVQRVPLPHDSSNEAEGGCLPPSPAISSLVLQSRKVKKVPKSSKRK
jgi:hypothetical protein